MALSHANGLLIQDKKAVPAEREMELKSQFDVVEYWFKQHAQHPDRLTLRESRTQALTAVGARSDKVAAGIQSSIYQMIRHANA